MMIQTISNNWYKIVTKAEYSHINCEVAVFKRMAAFTWIMVDMEFDSIEDAAKYVEYIEILEAA